MLDRHFTERAMVVDDAQLIAALVGVCCETVRGECVGDGLQGGAKRAMTSGEIVALEPAAIALAYC